MFSPLPHSSSPLFLACLLLGGIASATPSITLSVKSGPPTSKILVSGSGFDPNVDVNIYFDTKEEAKIVTDGQGDFAKAEIRAPRSAHPGKHLVKAVEQDNQQSAKQPFLVQTNWRQFHRLDMARFNPYENVLNPRTVKRLKLKWKYLTGGWVLSSPAVADGIVYVGSQDGNLYALDARTGAKVWANNTNNYVDSSPAVARGVVYVGSDGSNMYAFDARTGKTILIFSASGPSSPTVVRGSVFFGDYFGYSIYAVKAKNGKKLWTYAIGHYVDSCPAVANGVVYVGSYDGNVYALDASSGRRLWAYQTGSVVASSPAVVGGVVYVGSAGSNPPPGYLYALRANTGKELWSFEAGVSSAPVIADGVVYVSAEDASVYALDAHNGKMLWSQRAPSDASPAVANGVVYVSDEQAGALEALDAHTGAKLWSYTSGGYMLSSATVANGMVYVGTSDQNIYAFGLPDRN